MQFKLSSLVIVMVFGFIAKVTIETAMAEKVPRHSMERIPASIDKNYRDHMTAANNR